MSAKKGKLPKNPEAVPVVEGQKVREEPAGEPELKNKRGRPPKVRISLDVESEIFDALATMPEDLLKQLVETFTPYQLSFPEKQYKELGTALRAWMQTKEIVLTPGWALILLHLEVLGAGMFQLGLQVKAMAAQQAEAERQEAEARARAARAPPPPPAPEKKPAEIVRFEKTPPDDDRGSSPASAAS